MIREHGGRETIAVLGYRVEGVDTKAVHHTFERACEVRQLNGGEGAIVAIDLLGRRWVLEP